MMTWMLHAALAAGLIAGAALAIEEGLRLLGRPLRWGWMLAMTAAAVLPLLYQLLPPRPEPNGPAGATDPDLLAALLAQAPSVERSAGLLDQIIFGWQTDLLLTGAWLTAAAAMATALLLTYRRLAALRARAREVEIAGIPTLLTDSSGPMVVGFRRPQVVVPRWIETLAEQEQRLVMQHEHEHVRAGDPRLLLGAALLLTAMPWNLPLWWMCRRLRQALEVDCDARVLASGADRRLYGTMLIRTAGRPRPSPLLAAALVELPSLLERRIIAMTAKSPRHRDVRTGVALALATLLFAAACELTPRSTGPSPTEPTLAELLGGEAAERPAPDGEVTQEIRGEPVEVVYVNPDGADPALVSASGDTGRATTIRLRRSGDALATGSASPLVIVDGERVESVAAVDPGRIESVEVFKGRAALERYGPEAADGAVRITTRGAAAARTRHPGVPTASSVTGEARPSADGTAAARAARARQSADAGGTVTPQLRAPGVVRAQDYATNPVAEAVLLEARVEAVGYGVAEPARQPAGVSGAQAVRYGAAAASSQDPPPPLILVDGEVVPTLADVTARFEPGEIASIEVIKGETALTRYGARAEHGAVIITLKQR